MDHSRLTLERKEGHQDLILQRQWSTKSASRCCSPDVQRRILLAGAKSDDTLDVDQRLGTNINSLPIISVGVRIKTLELDSKDVYELDS